MSKSKDYVYNNLDVFDHVPDYLQNELNSSFSRNLFNKFLTKEEAVPVYGLIGNKTSTDTDTRPFIPQISQEHKINSLIPMIYAKNGTEETVLSFSDVVNKAKLLGIDVKNLSDWSACQSFNYMPPIDIDKFINFSSYFWYGKILKSPFKPSWNVNLDPEFYVIAKPNLDARVKFPVEIATTSNVVLTGSGHVDEEWVVTFIDSTNFEVKGKSSGISGFGKINQIYGGMANENSSFVNPYITFKISSGTVDFQKDDTFIISTFDLTDKYTFEYSGIGNGGISGIKGATTFQTIDGQTVYEGQRVLVKAQDVSSENGIYVVQAGAWTRASDCTDENTLNGIEVFVSNGSQTGLWESSIFTSSEKTIVRSNKQHRNVSEWTEFNFWVHQDDAAALGININKCIKAKRPIIEYSFDLEMNTDSALDKPLGGNVLFNAVQEKKKFNQLPLFNLYYADGSFADRVSSIFYYEEDSTAQIDKFIKRRIKLDSNNDFIFSQGCLTDDIILFFKEANQLSSIWKAGPAGPAATTPLYTSAARQIENVQVNIDISNVANVVKNCNWIAVANSNKNFVLKSKHYPELAVEIALNAAVSVYNALNEKLFDITISSDSEIISPAKIQTGDVITFKTINVERSRYVSGETLSTSSEIKVDDNLENGVWTTPFQLEYNVYHENRKSIGFGDLINHFKSVIFNQPGFSGSPFGRNNFRKIPNKHLGLGGKIKEHNGDFNKLIGLINQDNISPLSIIDFAETQYAQALNSVNEYVNKFAVEILTTNGAPSFSGNEDTSGLIQKYVDDYCEYYKGRVDVASYLSSSTSPIPNWPATLPALGLAEKVMPSFGFDQDLGINVIVHHDGHLSPKNQRNLDFDRNITKFEVLRSDGSMSAGIFSVNAPASPFMNQLWFNSNTGELKIFQVVSDSVAPQTPKSSDLWYDRQNDMLYQWASGQWVNVNKNLAWKIVETEKILNAMILEIEKRLYSSIHPAQNLKWDASQHVTADTLKLELAKFAAKYGYDPFAPDYSSTDAFTWNYKKTNFPVIGDGFSRWYDVYRAYFHANTGQIVTRPNLEPWKLLGHEIKPNWFDSLYRNKVEVNSSLELTPAVAVCVDQVDVNAAPSVVDGKQLQIGDRIVVTNGVLEGLYVVTDVGTGNNGTWRVAPDFAAPQVGNNVTVIDGSLWSSTTWVWSFDSSYKFVQARTWELSMWSEIAATGIKLCVNPFNEQLLPPYVDAGNPAAQFALTNILPVGTTDAYSFGDNGPTETVWQKSLEFAYSLLRSSMKNQSLKLIEVTWGDSAKTVDSFRINKQAGKKLSHKEFILHGETLSGENRTGIIQCSGLQYSGSPLSVQLVCDFVTDDIDFFQVHIDGIFSDYLHELGDKNGVDFTPLQLFDEGKGFQIGDRVSFTISESGAIENVMFEPAATKIQIGLGQWFAQLLKFNGFSLTQSKNINMFRNWEVNLGYRFGAFMNSDTLQLSSDAFDIPLGVCKLLTKVSPYADSSWINAIRIQLVQLGSTTLKDGVYCPALAGADWTFRIETYFNQHPEISYYELDNTGDFITFNALDKRKSTDTWKNYSGIKGVKTVTTPFLITGIQNVVDFLFGYTKFLSDQGWEVNSSATPDIDAETGRMITWQLEIEKFIDAVYNSMSPGDGHIVNPFLQKLWFKAPRGLVSKFETVNFLDVDASQFVFDMIGAVIPVNDLKIVREEDTTYILSDTPIFGGHVNVEHYEHCVLFPYYLDNANRKNLVFDPFLGMRLRKILVSGSRQAVQSARPSFGGFYMIDHQMKRNIMSSVEDLGRIYDSETAFNNPEISKYALALFGFTNKEYFENIGVNKKTQFNFWRGMIQAKGTNASIDAFINNSVYQDAKIDEYWAFKIAEYGDARVKSFPELKLRASDSLLDTTRFQFQDGIVAESVPGFTQIYDTDESRWINLDDLNELTVRGMYFDANVIGKVVINEKPQIVESSLLPVVANGGIKFVSNKQTVKTFMASVDVNIEFTSFDNFTVTYVKDDVIYTGQGFIGVPYSCADFEFEIENDFISAQPGDKFVFTISTNIFSLVKLPFISDKLKITGALSNDIEIISQNIVAVKTANKSITVEGYGPQKPKFSPIKLFDYQSDTFISNIPFWHPAVGQHTPEAHEIINVISPADPAKYNNTTQIVNNPNFDMLKPWGNKEVGKVWWNTKRLDYTPYYDENIYPDVEHRLSKWGALAEYSNVEVYEWIESNVPPEKYVTEVLSDISNTSKSQDEKKSGEPAIAKLLTRSRTWWTRPIAWKKNESSADSPFFTSALFNKIRLTSSTVGNSRAILNVGRFSDYGITSGMKLSAWDFISDIPAGQAQLTETLDYIFGAEFDFLIPSFANESISVDKSNKLSSIGSALGKITFSSYEQGGVYFVKAIEENTGKTQVQAISDMTISSASNVEYDFSELGFKLILAVGSGQLLASEVATIIGDPQHDLYIRESVEIAINIDFPDDRLVNDQADQDSLTHPFGWRAWVEPTQTDLNEDLRAPDNLWEPVFGDYTQVKLLTTDYLKTIKEYQDSKLVLNDGTIIEKFKSEWTDYVQLNDIFIEKIFDGKTSSLTIEVPTAEKGLDSSRVFIYLNGILQPESYFSVNKTNIKIQVAMEIGTKIAVVYKKYQPTAAELLFDPEAADDIYTNTQFKFGYDYTSFEIRDTNGLLTQAVYYFWVKNKNTPPANRKMSILQAKNLLTYGPSMYMTFHNIHEATDTLPVRYDSVAIFGLNKFANRDDTYKLRFTRNFTLRDDPNELDLKNVHSEWKLLRPAQNTRVPMTLWDKLVDSAVGTDIAGNSLPFTHLKDYDAQHGTSNRFGLGNGQILAEADKVVASIKHTLLNTNLTINLGGTLVPDYVQNLKLSQLDKYFDSPENIRKTMDFIWREAKPKQINEIFFAVINDALANNFEFKDVFKTSRLSVYSIKTVNQILTGTSDE